MRRVYVQWRFDDFDAPWILFLYLFVLIVKSYGHMLQFLYQNYKHSSAQAKNFYFYLSRLDMIPTLPLLFVTWRLKFAMISMKLSWIAASYLHSVE